MARGAKPTVVKFGDIFEAERASSVLIHEGIYAHAPYSPATAVYRLDRAPDGGLNGPATLRTRTAAARHLDVAIDPGTVADFFRALGSTKLTPGQARGSWPGLEITTRRFELVLHVPPAERAIGGVALLYFETTVGQEGFTTGTEGAFVSGSPWTFDDASDGSDGWSNTAAGTVAAAASPKLWSFSAASPTATAPVPTVPARCAHGEYQRGIASTICSRNAERLRASRK